MQAEDIRNIPNPFQKIVNIINPDSNHLYNLFFAQIQQFVKDSGLPTLTSITSDPTKSYTDVSAYNGVGGYTYVLIRLARFFEQISMKQEAEKIINSSNIAEDGLISQLKNKKYYLDLALKQYQLIVKYSNTHKLSKKSLAFYTSETCTWLCGMHLGFLTNNTILFRQNEKKVLECFQYYSNQKAKMMWEVLYGVPGFLYVFLELQQHYDNHPNIEFKTNFKPISQELTADIFQNGVAVFEQTFKKKLNWKDLSKQLPQNFRLIYLFYKKQYLGGAHGLGGNLNILLLSLQLNQFSIDVQTAYCRLISMSVSYLLKNFINGNFSSSAGSQKIKLVHFCHGAPGIVSALARFSLKFPENGIQMGITKVIQKALQHIWEFGVLKKGFGLCHGISGNAYAFIAPSVQKALPQMKKELQKKAMLFALLKQQKDVMKEIRSYNFSDRMKVGVSDEPYSLMLGLAGDICFTIDVINGVGAFPGFDLQI